MDLAECKGIYVIAEQFEGKLRDVSFELLSAPMAAVFIPWREIPAMPARSKVMT